MNVHDYESQSIYGNRLGQYLAEVYAGTDIVGWYGTIERQLRNMLEDAEKGRNWPYADKIRKYLDIWRSNEITGSMNRETLEILKSGPEVLAVDSWNLSDYFSTLRDQLRKLIASEEQLPRDMDMDQNNPMAGMGGGRGAPPMSPDFGPQDGAPDGAQPGGAPDDQNPEGGGPPLGTEPGGEGAQGGGLEGGPTAPGEEELPDDEPYLKRF
jgi:hypothetical protein